MVMYAYERIPKHIVSQVPKGWSIGKSTSGWMTSESFFEYITNIFYPWLLSENIQFPVILYLDGHKSHVTLPLTDYCREKQIILISLLPNSTHILQPLDVGLFKSLKMKWKTDVQNFKIQNNYKHLGKDTFASVLQNALSSITNVEDIFKKSFKVCGLCPFNADNIDYHKLLAEDNELNTSTAAPDPERVSHLQYLESFIQPDCLTKCYGLMGAEWTGEIKDKSLYEVWYKLYQKSGLSQNIEKTANIIIDIQEDLILEDGWENKVEFEADDTLQGVIFDIQDIVKDTEIEEELLGLSAYAVKELTIIEEMKSIDETGTKEIFDETKKTNVIGKKINVLEIISLAPEKRIDIIESERIPKESVNNKNDSKEILGNVQLTPETQNNIIEDEQVKEESDKEEKNNTEKILVTLQLTPEKSTVIEEKQLREELVNKDEDMKTCRSNKHSRVLPGVVIPSPFKNSLFWPEPTKKITSRKCRIKVPSVGTSDAWRQYFLKKDEDQKNAIREKEERKRKREENKKLREENIKKPRKKIIKNKQKRTEEEKDGSVSDEESTKDNDDIKNSDEVLIGEIKIGDFVIVTYFEEYYPAQITDKNSEKMLANAMVKAGGWWK
ncbi:uncharacterized protein [Diabrotica undecimpunctata]|uniref:uncharacterized protein n=1 Tax=Diabrotica undecimpunctata TaxID=50387 RepID=UPI003B637CAD